MGLICDRCLFDTTRYYTLSMYCRFVCDVRVWIISPKLCLLHAYVNTSMKSPEKLG